MRSRATALSVTCAEVIVPERAYARYPVETIRMAHRQLLPRADPATRAAPLPHAAARARVRADNEFSAEPDVRGRAAYHDSERTRLDDARHIHVEHPELLGIERKRDLLGLAGFEAHTQEAFSAPTDVPIGNTWRHPGVEHDEHNSSVG